MKRNERTEIEEEQERGHVLEEWMLNIMDTFGYLGVGMLILVENLFPPIPSEVILTFGGFMTATTAMTVWGVILASTIGAVLGALALYAIGRFLDARRLERLIKRYGHILRVTEKDIQRAERFFQEKGIVTIFFCRFIPLIRSLISIPAGMAHMRLLPFIFFTALGTGIWNTALVYAGAKVGDNWEDIVHYMDIYSNIMYILIVVFTIAFGVYFIKKRGFLMKKKEQG